MSQNKVRAIAFYLPQFYPTSENDEWWEPGFTEWTNVARAKPLFKGHYQPRIPRDLGFYDLRVPETREKQAELARDAGIEGFCYWHYWFGNGKRLLDRVFREVVESGKPDFPFCLCWANHTWFSKTWDPNLPDKVLVEQTYPGEDDFIAHFNAMLPAFKDKRYMKVNGKLLFGFFEPWDIDITMMSSVWNKMAKDNGLDGFEFFAFCQGVGTAQLIDATLFDSIVVDPFLTVYDRWTAYRNNKKKKDRGEALFMEYSQYAKECIEELEDYSLAYPCIEPDFDHAPRSGIKARILHNSSPELWRQLCEDTLNLIKHRPEEERIVFIKAWNEWGEGNYLEPDRKWGKRYIEETAKAFKK